MNVIYRDKGSWYDIETMLQTIKDILAPISKNIPPNKKGIILLDNCRAHYETKAPFRVKELLMKYRFEPVLLPPNTTASL